MHHGDRKNTDETTTNLVELSECSVTYGLPSREDSMISEFQEPPTFARQGHVTWSMWIQSGMVKVLILNFGLLWV